MPLATTNAAKKSMQFYKFNCLHNKNRIVQKRIGNNRCRDIEGG